MSKKNQIRVALSALLFAAGLVLSSASTVSGADSYWRPTTINDCPNFLVCATRDLENACCIEPKYLWTTDGASCPSEFRHLHGFDEQL